MIEAIFILFLISCFSYIVYATVMEILLENAIRKNILAMLDAGYAIEKCKKHIFRSGKAYKIYHFDNDSNVIDVEEEIFNNGDEAVSKFLKICGQGK